MTLKFIAPLLFTFCLTHAQDVASVDDIQKLKKLSIEELMNIEVTSVSKGSQKLTEVASAIQVLTREDILRSGATNIPEALRLLPNLQVAQVNSNAYVISARGFNTIFANKLLVLIDGRTVYTPLFGGVLWDLQHVLIEDVDRIEVISGPGATLWGANAVNGVINIITRKASDSEGVYASVAGSPGSLSPSDLLEKKASESSSSLSHLDLFSKHLALRYGSKIGNVSYRVYGQHYDRGNTLLTDSTENADSWKTTQAGFRADWQVPTGKDVVTVQGDVYKGEKRTTPEYAAFDGQNLLTRWSHKSSEVSDYMFQVYYDRYWRDDPATADELYTVDVDFQQRLLFGRRHNFLYGGGYRYAYDKVLNFDLIAKLLPPQRSLPIYNIFVQDEISVFENFKVTLGVKVLHNVFSDYEYQPNARFVWTVNSTNMIWGAASRAIRAPSRLDVDYVLQVEPGPPIVKGTENFDSEKLHAFELGYRFQPNVHSSFSIASFYNQYHDVYSVDLITVNPLYLEIQNGAHAKSWGAELSGFYQVTPSWRLKGGFTYYNVKIEALEGRAADNAVYLSNDAKHHVALQSFWNLPANFKLDINARYLDYIRPSQATGKIRVPEYFTFDTRIAWVYQNFELSIIGQNLYKETHREFGTNLIPRSVYGRITCRF